MSFAELLAYPGVEEDLVLRGRFGFMAPHGGNLEDQTDVVAAAAAALADASLYAVRQPSDLRWHIPSTALTPDVSPALAAFLDRVDAAIAVHGYGRPSLRGVILVGGRDRELAGAVAAQLRAHVPQHPVLDDLDAIPARAARPPPPQRGEPGGAPRRRAARAATLGAHPGAGVAHRGAGADRARLGSGASRSESWGEPLDRPAR